MSFTLMTRAVPVVARQQRRRTIISGVAASLSSSSSLYSSAYFTTALPTSYPYSYSSPLSINNYHHPNQRQQQRQQQQIRSYLFIPMSWPELKERAERWLEKTESRIVKVRLLNRQRLQKLQQLRRRKRDRDRDDNENNNVVRRPIITPITTTTAATTATATNSSSNKIRIKYQGWKIRRKDQYVSWKSRRKDQYMKRKDQYVSWKSRRRDQYVRYWTKDNTTSTSRIKMKDKLKLSLRLWGRKNILLEEYSKPEWFDSKTGYPLTSKDSTGQRYVNPWQSQSTNGVQSISAIFEWQCQRFIRTMRRSLALPLLLSSITSTTTTATTTATTRSSSLSLSDNNDNNDNNISPLSSQTIQPLPLLLNPNLPSESGSRSNELYMTWIGHSTCLFQMCSGSGSQSGDQSGDQSGQNYSSDYWSILTDPMFSTRASPYKHWIGIPRDVQPAYTIQDILNHQQQQQQQQCTSLGGQEETTKEEEEEEEAQALLPGLLDICCITHDHYDHMDMNSVRELKDHVQLWIVPLGIADWLVERCSINRKQIIELEWWQNVRIIRSKKKTNKNGRRRRVVIIEDDDDVGSSNNTNDDNDNNSDSDNNEILTITCCPASHWSGRTILDRNKRLWCSFAMSLSTTSAPSASTSASALSSYESESKSKSLLSSSNTNTNTKKLFDIFFCGDTSYPNNFPLFRQIGDALGPFDLSCIPIGAYLPKEMNKDAHCDPYEALQIHNDIQSKQSIAIHWGSFNLGEEPLYEPPQLLYDAILKQEEIEKKKLEQKQKQQRVDNNDDDDKEVSSCPSIKFDVLRHGESRKII